MAFYLGVDGGGTKTTAAVSDEKGNIIYKAVGKTINFYSVGMKKATENLTEIMEDIYNNLDNVVFENAFIGCSALDNRADYELTKNLCKSVNAKSITMDSDAYVALFSGDETLARCVLICGTGSMVIGFDGEKTTVKGGWGHIIGDGGSAYSIAVNGLCEAVNCFDENCFDSVLLKKAQLFFNTDDLRKIIDKVYSADFTKDEIARFASYVSEACEEGDEKAFGILKNECEKLFRTTKALVNHMKKCEIVYMYGGVFENNEKFRSMFSDMFNVEFPYVKIEMLNIPPEEGALKIARGLCV